MELTIPAAECVGHKIAHYGLGSMGYTDEVIVLTSCNGLVLIGHWCYCECLSIWNPSTGFFRRVPSPRITIENREIDEILEYTVYVFGYVSSTDDYKIVLGVPRTDTYFHVFIFSLRANCWRVIEAPHLSSEDTTMSVGAFFSGAIHWFNFRFGFSEPATLYAFDLVEEEFREFPLPVSFRYMDCTRVLSGGCLYVCSVNDRFDCSGEIWGMTQYVVAESWVKLFEIRPADLPDVWHSPLWDVCFVTEDGKLVIKVFDTNELVKFESRKEEELVELTCIGRYLLPDVPEFTDWWYVGDLYAETLISVPE